MKNLKMCLVVSVIVTMAFSNVFAENEDEEREKRGRGRVGLTEIIAREMDDDMSKKEVKKVLGKLEKLIPELKQMKALSFEHEMDEENTDVVIHLIHEYNEGQEIREEEPRDFKHWQKRFVKEGRNRVKNFLLDYKSRQLGREIRECKDETKRNKLSSELKEMLEQVFNNRIAERQREIDNIEKELKELKGLIERRTKNKDRIIRKRYDDLTGQNEDLEWD